MPDELIQSGLCGPGPVEPQQHAFSGAVGRTIVCMCGFEAPTVAAFQSHLGTPAGGTRSNADVMKEAGKADP